jgi:AAA+ superfamily predicted ATPase
MSTTAAIDWKAVNQTQLTSDLADVRRTLARFLSCPESEDERSDEKAADARSDGKDDPSARSALDVLSDTFGLSAFERKILLMSAGAELDSRFASLYATAAKDPRSSHPTFSLALSAFDDAHWSALLPTRPLRFWHLLEVVPGDGLTTSPLRIEERILHYLAGISCIDERLRSLTEPLRPTGDLPQSQRAVADQMAEVWSRSNWQAGGPVMQVCGADARARRNVAALACGSLGLSVRVLSSSSIPRPAADLELFTRLWEREVALSPTALLVECDEADAFEPAAEAALKRLMEGLRTPLLLAVRERKNLPERTMYSFGVPKPSAAEQRGIWKEALGSHSQALNGDVERLVSQFSLDPNNICAVVAQALPADALSEDARDLSAELWNACRVQTRPRLEGLAQRIEAVATWDDLVLPEHEKQLLCQIALHLRQRAKVYQSWGFAAKSSRGLGISALFAGPSGTGKTMAGEVVANELRLDLCRIDLSQVVSKYIGETEKNLRRVFDAAEDSAAILLFDEADALFGKRSEVKDSHDRYANIEVSYLLQRMEAYRGLAILTTNRKEALDPAFLRRIRFVVEFPFPEAAQRAEIWRRVFPRQTPTEGLQVDRLAKLHAAGGHIHNIAMGAAFLAADAGEPVRMSHLLAAARNEFAKLERPLTDSEVSGWA